MTPIVLEGTIEELLPRLEEIFAKLDPNRRVRVTIVEIDEFGNPVEEPPADD